MALFPGGRSVASELVAEIKEMGLAASLATSGTNPKVNDLMLTGYFESVDAGSATGRVLLGFGSGSSELRTVVEGYEMSTLGPRLLGSGTVESSGNKTPGLVAPLVVLAATGNPIGLNDNEKYRVVWQVLNALRTHDVRLGATINKLGLGEDVSDRIEIIGVTEEEANATTAVIEDLLDIKKREKKPDIGGEGGDDQDRKRQNALGFAEHSL